MSFQAEPYAAEEVNLPMMENRYERGWKKLKEIDGETGERVISSLKDIAPDLGKYIIEYSFGDVYSREGLSLKHKEIAVVAALTAMGNAMSQLKVHLNGALNVGCTIEEVKEIIIQMSIYAGFPASLNSMNAFKEVLRERVKKEYKDERGTKATCMSGESRYETGVEWLSRLDKDQANKLKEGFGDISPDIVKYTIEYPYGDIYSRTGLDLKSRQIAAIAALTALGTATTQLKFHINAGLNVGLTKQEITEVMILMSVYAGFPASLNGSYTAKEVFETRK
jgi:4-carboxymuconolactone decarboxylase